MKENLLNQIKSVLIEKKAPLAWAYYDIISKTIDTIDPDFEFNYSVSYSSTDLEQYCGNENGTLTIYETCKRSLKDVYTYEINLYENDRMIGYCQCEHTDLNFNFEHKCCGEKCDWYQPYVTYVKREYLGEFSYEGKERDLWKLENEWNGVKKETEEDKILKEMAYYDEIIKQYEEAKQRLLSK